MNHRRMSAAALALSLPLVACGASDKAAQAPQAPAAGSSPTAAVAAARSESRQFRDWYAVCDNGNGCATYSGGSTGWIRIGLDAGPDAQPVIQVGMWPEGEALPGPLVVVIDGQRHAIIPDADDSARGRVAAGDVRAVLSALAAAKSLGLAAGAQTVEISPAGSSAALLWIDERQGRLDNVTALIRTGANPASSVPAAPALPVITAAAAVNQEGFKRVVDPADPMARPNAVPSAALEAVPAVKTCRADTAFNPYLQKAVSVARLDAQTELWGVPCDGGAYNFSYAYFLTGPNGVNARPVRFPGVDGAAPANPTEGDSGLLVNPDYDPKTRILSAFAKARGMGDCGTLQTWTWTGQAFALSREQVMQDCWGMSSDFWPTTFRSQ